MTHSATDISAAPASKPILAFSTKGAGSNEEERIRTLLSRTNLEVFPFNRAAKSRSMRQLLRRIREIRPALVVMEGTGLAGGLACMLGRILFGCRYVVSSGDAVGPWIAMKAPLLGPLFALYERLLCRLASGFIGWTPYLVGRAMTFGCPRAMTAAGWSPIKCEASHAGEIRKQIRATLNISDDAIVFGIAGSLSWSRRYQYCYGLELVRALAHVDRKDVVVVVVGGGDGQSKLTQIAGDRLGTRVHLTGNVPQSEVFNYLLAMDVASLPQSVDGVGSFRYTTKISEYVAAGLPVITGQIPLAYDFHGKWLWRLLGENPWDQRYIDALADVMQGITHDELKQRRQNVPAALPDFCREQQIERATEFVNDLLDRCA